MESPRPKIEKEIYQGVNKICYTNVNGLMSTKLELEELLVRVKPDILVSCKTSGKMSGVCLILEMEFMIFG